MSWSQESGAPPPGWYSDPEGPGQRWWDGERWTDEVSSEEFVLHPPSASVPHYPWRQPAAPPPSLSRPRPSPPPRVFWALPAIVVAMIAGAAGDWASIGFAGGEPFVTVGGLQNSGDGWLVVMAALVAAILMAVWVFERAVLLPLVAGVMGVVGALVALRRAFDPGAGLGLSGLADARAGWGVSVAIVASLALTAVSTWLVLSAPAGAGDDDGAE